ncbi:MAG: protein-glutamate O-methyltransferase [Pseudomonadota bacterium]
MSTAALDRVCKLVYDKTGIVLSKAKHDLIQRRLRIRMKATGVSSLEQYMAAIAKPGSPEEEQFFNVMTTNLTSFFRESHHFDFLANTIVPEIQVAKRNSDRRLRIWSAGCSTGEEPYSIAITLRETMSDIDRWDAKVLCTDLDTSVVQTAKAGIYKEDRLDKMPSRQLRQWFEKQSGDRETHYRAVDALRELLVFKPLNLMHRWPMRGKFDVIFCRNVVIYFDKPTQRKLMARYYDALEDGGYLILGHSESLFNVSDSFDLLGHTVYRKK